MRTTAINKQDPTEYELRFRSLFDQGRGYSLPCDLWRHVDIDSLSDCARHNHFFRAHGDRPRVRDARGTGLRSELVSA